MTFAKTVIALLAAFWVVMTLNTAFSRRKKRSAPRITKAELDGFWAAVNAASLPMVKIELAAKPPAHARQNRIGGRPFAGGQAWPLHPRDGQPMLFLAQINFAELPPLEDFPRAGLLQLFVASDDTGKLRTMEAEEDRVLRWFPAPEGDDTLPVPARFLGLTEKSRRPSPYAVELVALEKTDSEIIEIVIDAENTAANKEIRDLSLPETVLIVAIMRDNALVTPRGDTRLAPEDVLYVLTPKRQAGCIQEVFATSGDEVCNL